MKTLNLPRGTPITATFPEGCNPSGPVNGTIVAVHGLFYDYLIEDKEGEDILCFQSEVKIRYDNPRPFTIWMPYEDNY